MKFFNETICLLEAVKLTFVGKYMLCSRKRFMRLLNLASSGQRPGGNKHIAAVQVDRKKVKRSATATLSRFRLRRGSKSSPLATLYVSVLFASKNL